MDNFALNAINYEIILRVAKLYHARSFSANPLSRSPGQVKLDSDK